MALDYVSNTDLKIGFVYHVTEAHELVVCTGNGFLLVEEFEAIGLSCIKRGESFQKSRHLINPTKNYQPFWKFFVYRYTICGQMDLTGDF